MIFGQRLEAVRGVVICIGRERLELPLDEALALSVALGADSGCVSLGAGKTELRWVKLETHEVAIWYASTRAATVTAYDFAAFRAFLGAG